MRRTWNALTIANGRVCEWLDSTLLADPENLLVTMHVIEALVLLLVA